jgi:crotonobetainyl-CoA:carnitine CoA-transferase CaiB-like acyl-CoA transferase
MDENRGMHRTITVVAGLRAGVLGRAAQRSRDSGAIPPRDARLRTPGMVLLCRTRYAQEAAARNMTDGPLAGFRILDLSSVISGPFCTMLLGDLGADIIKVESPEGDTLRTFSRPQKNGVSAGFLSFNRNKRSIIIDLRKDGGRDLLRRMAAKADALIENNRPGVADRLGVGYADIRRINPKIVYCSISGFGPDGPNAQAPAYDPLIQGYSGLMMLQGARIGHPTGVQMAMADKITGMTTALCMVSALHAARNRGVGQYVRVPMLEALIAFNFNDTGFPYVLQPPEEFKDQMPKGVTLEPFKTKDGYVAVGPFTDTQYQGIAVALNHPEWWDESVPRMQRVRALLRNSAAAYQEINSADLLAALGAQDVPCAPVHTYETLFQDADAIANQLFFMYDHPDAGTVRTNRCSARFSETPMMQRRIPPRLGEHTDEVLRECGIERTEIEELRTSGVIK